MTSNRLAPLFGAALVLVALPLPVQAQDRPLALKGATIETVGEAGRIDSGVIVLRDGKIEEVGPLDEVDIPEDAQVIDASGRTIMPGIVEPTLSARGTLSGGSGTVIIGNQVVTIGRSSSSRTPSFSRAADLFDPYRTNFDPLLRSGLTYLNLLPPDYGQTAVIRIVPDDPDAAILEHEGRLMLSLSNSTPTLELLRKSLQGASRSGSSGRGSSGSAGSDQGASRPQGSGSSGSSDPSRDLWRAVVEGKAPLLVDAGNAASILYLLEATKEYEKVQIGLIASGSDVMLTLDQLADHPSITLILRPTVDTMPQNRDRINVPRIVQERGINFAFSQGFSRAALQSGQDTPLFDVGYLIATGLPRDEAMKALTSRPADVIGMGDTLGRIEAGKSASLLIFDGDPFDPYSRLRTVILEGKTVYETD
ncbi:amidohydrolase family protein [Tautonia rosea]|uniref:amidohydrolase family protein n=1 Tax=Tautonia rosea TaxID=2728037 RepID=UPI0014741338|nr:amidohydrolase family protein [Tautonia rosea]